MIRLFDCMFSLIGLLLLLPILLLLMFLGFLDTQSPIFIQERMGKNKKRFQLIKFRTMLPSTAQVATHLVKQSNITRYGSFLRRSKLDELPQLMNVLIGDMSLVGPRPNLPSQTELIQERETRGVYAQRPGITGLAQIKEIDMSTPALLAETDQTMIENFNTLAYFKYIFLTIGGKGSGDRVKKN